MGEHGGLAVGLTGQGGTRASVCFFFQAEDGIRDVAVTGVQTCALPILRSLNEIAPQDTTIAVVGGGFGSLLVYTTAVFLGFRPEQLAVYGENPHAVSTYQQIGRASCRERGSRSVGAVPARHTTWT